MVGKKEKFMDMLFFNYITKCFVVLEIKAGDFESPNTGQLGTYVVAVNHQIPSWLWLILISANYLTDRIVLRWSLGDMPGKGLFCRKHNWKICIAGFVSDFAGAILLFALNQLMIEACSSRKKRPYSRTSSSVSSTAVYIWSPMAVAKISGIRSHITMRSPIPRTLTPL